MRKSLSLRAFPPRLTALAMALIFSSAVGCSGDDPDVGETGGDAGRDAAVVKDAGLDAKSEAASMDATGDRQDAASDHAIEAATDTGAPAIDGGNAQVDTGTDASPEAGLDASPEAGVDARADAAADVAADASTVDAAAADVSVPSDAQPDRTVTEAGSDSAVVDASPDVSADAGADATLDAASDARDAGSADAQAPDSATASDAAIDGSLPVNSACLACEEQQGCSERLGAFDALTGAQRTAGVALMNCIRTSSCDQGNALTLTCYCGTADGTECLATSGAVTANGVCKAQFEQAVGSTNPQEIQNAISETALPNPALAVYRVLECDLLDECRDQCVPYLASQRDH